jgi:hypothetical protein
MTKELKKRHFSINGLGNIEGYISEEEPENIYFNFQQMQEITKIINNNTTYSLLQKDFYFQFLNPNKTVEIILRGAVTDIGNGDLDTFYNFTGFGLIEVEMLGKKIRETIIKLNNLWEFNGFIEDDYFTNNSAKTVGFEKDELFQFLNYVNKASENEKYYTNYYFSDDEQAFVIEDKDYPHGNMLICPVEIESTIGETKEVFFIGEWSWKWDIKKIKENKVWKRK